MTTWKRGGYVIRQYANDHDPPHVHVFHDGRLVAKFDLRGRRFITITNKRHAGRIIAALRAEGLIS